MTIKLLQLNINGDNYWDTLIPFLAKNDFDIFHFQELAGKNTLSGNINSTRDCFAKLQQVLSTNYKSELAISQRYLSDPVNAYMGNAIFYKNNFALIEKNILTLNQNTTPFPPDVTQYESLGRTFLHLTFQIEGKQISFMNTHFAWAHTPTEEPHQTEQGEILLKYLQNVPKPFVLTGDFNLDPNQPTIQKISKLSRNLIAENHITNTLNPRTHRAKELFPQGVAVDYIFVSDDLTIKQFGVVEDDISDHFGLRVEIEI